MIYLFDKDEKLFKIINKPALKTVLQKYALTTEQYVSDRLTVEMKSLDADELEKVEYMAIQTIEDAHTFHYFYVAQKYTEQLTTLIGVQSGIEELRKTPVWDKRPKNAFAKNVINDLLKGTNWQARFVGETTQRSTSFYYISVFEALKKVCKVWDLEMQFFVEMNGNKIGARYIDFKRKIGSAVGKRVVYGHNALQILQEVERTNLFTALIGRGKGEQVSSAEESDKKTDGYGRKITFENVVWDVAKGNPANKPKGQRFVELPEMTKVYGIKNTDGSIRPKIGFVDFQEEEDPGVLLERTYKALVDTARPQLTLKTTSAYLRGVKVGDTIRVVRHDKKLDYDTRIFEITFNRLNNESSDIKLGDRIGESNEAKAQTIAEKVVDDFVSNEFSDFVQKLPDFLPSPDGFNNNWYGAEDPTVKYPGKVLINDIWFKPDPEHEGHKIMLRWTGEVWDEILRSYDKELLTKRISEEIDNFDKTFQSVNEQNKKKIDEILQSSGASSLLAQEAKQIGFDAMARLEAITNPQNGLIATQIANYKQSVDGRFADITSLIAGKANQTDFQRVKETSQLYERILGSTDNGIADNVARMALTNQLFQVEVAKISASGRNLFLSSTATKGYLGRAGVINVANSTQKEITSDFISVEPNEKIIFQHWVTLPENGMAFSAWQFFDKNKETIDARVTGSNAYKTATGKQHNINQIIVPANAYFIRVSARMYNDGLIKIERGSAPSNYSAAPEDTDEVIRTVQSQLAGSWGVHNKNSVNEIIAGFNLAGRNAGIKAETIRLEGNTLADKLTAIDGYFKRLFVGEGTFATLNADVIRTNSITADKLVFNEALANRMVSNEHITNKLVASRAFVNALNAVTIDASQIVTGTLRGDRIYGGVIRGTEINGTTITGNSRITIGDNGFLRPTQEGGLQINVPETFNASKGIGVQLFGRNFGQIPKGMFIYNSPNWDGGNLIGESVADTLLTVKGLTSLCNLYRGQPMSGLPINSNFRYGDPVGNLYRISFIAWDPRHGQMFVNDGTDTDGTWWFKPDASSSDKRLKVNIQETDFEATDFVKKLEFKQFDWKPDKFGYKKPYTNVGLIAQDVEKLDSSLVYPQGENLALDDFRLGNIALKAIQELSQRIETLERKLA